MLFCCLMVLLIAHIHPYPYRSSDPCNSSRPLEIGEFLPSGPYKTGEFTTSQTIQRDNIVWLKQCPSQPSVVAILLSLNVTFFICKKLWNKSKFVYNKVLFKWLIHYFKCGSKGL